MDVTVILCTFNRCRSLEQALTSVLQSECDETLRWEVLVVDNNSTDDTRAVVERLAAGHSTRLRYEFEPNPGKSNALNRGVANSQGAVLAFMDDDVIVEPDWLQKLTAPIRAGSVVCTGGKICPEQGFTRPKWLALSGEHSLGGILALFDLGQVPTKLTRPPFGTNMAFRREIFQRYGTFRTDLGPRPGSEIRNEDTEFGMRLLDGGESLLYVPDAVVYHSVPSQRVSKQYFLQWSYDFGRAIVREEGRRVTSQVRRFLMVAVAFFRWMFTFGSVPRFRRKFQLWARIGEVAETYRPLERPGNKSASSNATSGKGVSGCFKAGDWVQVRSKEDILQTLDADGRLEGMPFMPEMFEYCGQKLQVYKRAHKTCDTVFPIRGRKLENTVHLSTRCNGCAHGGCQAECLIFWKEAWLKPVASANSMVTIITSTPAGKGKCTESVVWAAAQAADRSSSEPRYVCQATRLPYFTNDLHWWDVRQYVEDYTSGNVGLWRILCGLVYSITFHLSEAGIGAGRPIRWLYDKLHRIWSGTLFPRKEGAIPMGAPTPVGELNLQPGELVRVKSHEEILKTVNQQGKNRGMYWDAEMVPYCGGTYKVLKRVSRILDEKTGKMQEMKTPSIMLESVVCQSRYSECRMFCPRSIHSYWREIWLERVEQPAAEAQELKSSVSAPDHKVEVTDCVEACEIR